MRKSHMKTMLAAVVALLLAAPTEKKILNNNEHVKIELRAPSKISASTTGEIAFFFTPEFDIHVNTTPAFELVLDKNSAFEAVDTPRYQKNNKDYLDTTKPIEFSFKVKKEIKPGKQLLKGSLRYFYCSDKEGWCNRYVQPIEVSIEITK